MSVEQELRDKYENWSLGSKGPDILLRAADEIKRLRAALEPFGKNAKAESLVEALGHITHEDIELARQLTTGYPAQRTEQ